MHKLYELVKLMFRIGCIGFGGGSALIPIIEKEVVADRELVTKDEYDRNVVVASVTPGALPVEIASGIGYSVASYKGMVAGAVGMALPGAILTILLLTLFSNMEKEALKQIKYLSVGISVYIIYLLIQYIRNTMQQRKKLDRFMKVVFIMGIVFLLNGEKEINTFLGIDRVNLFDISSIQVLAIAFFLMFFLSGKYAWHKFVGAGIIILLYLLCIGKAQIVQIPELKQVLEILMFVLGAYGVIQSVRQQQISLRIDFKRILKCLFVWIIIFGILVFPACIYGVRSGEYIGKGLLSSLVSFGGGDAYLSVAEGLFVNSGMLSEEVFYGQLVMIVNILPGSILCKTLSGAGYLIGFGATGKIGIGIAMALAGFGISIFGSCSIFMSCLHIYSELERIAVFRMVSTWIRPVIAGLLMSICVSLLSGNMAVGSVCGSSASVMLGMSVLIYGSIVFAERRGEIQAWGVILMAMLMAVVGCNGIEMMGNFF